MKKLSQSYPFSSLSGSLSLAVPFDTVFCFFGGLVFSSSSFLFPDPGGRPRLGGWVGGGEVTVGAGCGVCYEKLAFLLKYEHLKMNETTQSLMGNSIKI